MSVLYLSFNRHLNDTSLDWSDYYSESLIDQYERIKTRISRSKQIDTFRDFICAILPEGYETRYSITFPNFQRELKEIGRNHNRILRNIVVKISNKYLLPDNQSLILVGDINVDKENKFLDVKGIELIDTQMESPNDKKLMSIVHLNFDQKFPFEQSMSSVFTNDFITTLISECWPVKDYKKVIDTCEKWGNYLDARKYLLDERTNKNYKIHTPQVLTAYRLERRKYNKKIDIYKPFLLLNDPHFEQKNMVLLNTEVEKSDRFDIVEVIYDVLKPEYDKANISNSRGHGKERTDNKIFRNIRSLARENAMLSMKSFGQGADKEDEYFEAVRAGVTLGDCFTSFVKDVLPKEEISAIEQNYAKELAKAKEDAKTNFEVQIKNEVTKNNLDEVKETVKENLNEKFNEYNNKVLSNKTRLFEDKKKAYLNSERKKLKKLSQKEIDELIETETPKWNEAVEQELSKKIDQFKNKLVDTYQSEIETEIDYLAFNEINNRQGELQKRIDEITKESDAKKQSEIEDCKSTKTIKRIMIYFYGSNFGDETIKEEYRAKVKKCKFLMYDRRPEQAKITRQSLALENFVNGYVKNPYLSTYLFESNTLTPLPENLEDWKWYLESLNDKQKEATKKAFFSNGIFLLQGPPGTGKTQVIAETIAHLTSAGKKVYVSSETHKAIDNVFDRLPKVADIIPLRMIPDTKGSKKENEYDPKYLVDNFYKNITDSMTSAIERFSNFNNLKETFKEDFGKLKYKISKINKGRRILEAVENKKAEINEKKRDYREKNEDLDQIISGQLHSLEFYEKTKRFIKSLESYNGEEDLDTAAIKTFNDDLAKVISKDVFASGDVLSTAKKILHEDVSKVAEAIERFDPESSSISIELQKDALNRRMNEILNIDPTFDDQKNKDEFQECQNKYKSLINKQDNNDSSNTTHDILKNLFNLEYLKNHIDQALDALTEARKAIEDCINSACGALDEKCKPIKQKIDANNEMISQNKEEIKKLDLEINNINESDDVANLNRLKDEALREVDNFLKKFDIFESYKDLNAAEELISRKWNELEKDSEKNAANYQNLIPLYERIVKYLSRDEVIEQDREEYTKDLFSRANVFGTTCSASQSFSEKNVDSLSEYGLGELTMKNVGIDVVIIDEVSKSSFIDLLVPILYGKTVILVGDHRQLPPMYDLRHMKDDEFEDLDSKYIDKAKNKAFTAMYEECFFKTLFENTSPSFKTMLDMQYRCHGDIMKVFNHFYSGKLKLGQPNQNQKKKHNIDIKFASNARISPENHVYFINCNGHDTHDDNGTSYANEDEANVVVKLVTEMNNFYKNTPCERQSLGVICTYRSQANRIKNKLAKTADNANIFRGLKEKLIVSTVDDFQGDERDIIIVSLVRNPEDPKHANTEFINAYQRVNVALSRARKLLIVVGNRHYLESKGIIDLPSVDGSDLGSRNFRIYEKIIGTISSYGEILNADDIIKDAEER